MMLQEILFLKTLFFWTFYWLKNAKNVLQFYKNIKQDNCFQ